MAMTSMLQIRWPAASVFRAISAKKLCASTASVWPHSAAPACSQRHGCDLGTCIQNPYALWNLSALGYSNLRMTGCSKCTRITTLSSSLSSSQFLEKWFGMSRSVLVPSLYLRGTRPSTGCGMPCIIARVVASARWFSEISRSTNRAGLASDGRIF